MIWLPSQAFQFTLADSEAFDLYVFSPLISPLIPREGSNTVLQFCFGLDF